MRELVVKVNKIDGMLIPSSPLPNICISGNISAEVIYRRPVTRGRSALVVFSRSMDIVSSLELIDSSVRSDVLRDLGIGS